MSDAVGPVPFGTVLAVDIPSWLADRYQDVGEAGATGAYKVPVDVANQQGRVQFYAALAEAPGARREQLRQLRPAEECDWLDARYEAMRQLLLPAKRPAPMGAAVLFHAAFKALEAARATCHGQEVLDRERRDRLMSARDHLRSPRCEPPFWEIRSALFALDERRQAVDRLIDFAGYFAMAAASAQATGERGAHP